MAAVAPAPEDYVAVDAAKIVAAHVEDAEQQDGCCCSPAGVSSLARRAASWCHWKLVSRPVVRGAPTEPEAKRVLVAVAVGTEPLEAAAAADILNRAGARVTVATVGSASEGLVVEAAHGVRFAADARVADLETQEFDLIVLPGGMVGPVNLRDCKQLEKMVRNHEQSGRLCAAIGAAPAVGLAHWGVLKGFKATCHPALLGRLGDDGVIAVESRVVKDRNVVTSQGVGTAIEFALELVEQLYGKRKATEVAGPLASTFSFASNLKELEELKRKLAQSKEDSLRLQEQVEKAQVAEKDLAGLRAELEKARSEAEQQKATALKSAEELAEALKTRQAAQSRISEIEEDLKSVITECDDLRTSKERDAAKLKKLSMERQEVASRANAAKEELRQATDIAAGTFSDLPRSVEDACQHFGERDDAAEQKSFWMQFQEVAHPQLLGDQLKQLAELHRAAKPAMEDLCIVLWPSDPLSTSFFGLVQRLEGAVAQVELWKRSACMEDAREAYAAVRTWYPKLDLEPVAQLCPGGKKREASNYFMVVMPAARVSEKKCKKEVILENLD